MKKKFTQYERDTETGLDYAQARYYSSLQGRFTTSDPLMASAIPNAPQTWNRYSYGLNNPLKYIDPSGLNADDIGTAEDQRRQQEEQRRQQPAQGQPNPVTTVSATLAQEEIPLCSPDDLPMTVTVAVVNTADSVQRYLVGGVEALRIGVDLSFTFTNANGGPVSGMNPWRRSKVIQYTKIKVICRLPMEK